MFTIDLKENLNTNEIIIRVDYTEGYKNIQQDEIQSEYFGHTNFSLFTACCYKKEANKLLKKSLVIVSELTDHSRFAAHTCITRIIEEMSSEVQGDITVHIWSDGCASQFRSRYVFAFTHTGTDLEMK